MSRAKRPSGEKFDAAAKRAFLAHFSENGLVKHAATAAAITERCVQMHRKSDEAFEAAYQEAKADYRDKVVNHAARLCLEGIPSRCYSKGELVSETMRYPERLLEVLLKRVEPEFRESQSIDLSVKGGVLIAPATSDAAEWDRQFSATASKPAGDGK